MLYVQVFLCHNWMKKYVSFDRIFAIAEKFIGISDSVGYFFHRVFRATGILELLFLL